MSTLPFIRANLRWLAAGFVLCFASSFGQTFFVSLFGAQYRAEFGLSDGDFGLIYTIATVCAAATLLRLGKLADKISPAHLGPMIAGGLALATAAVALAPNAIILGVAFFGLRLFGQGMLSHVAMTAMSRWYDAQRGRAVSIAALGFPTGEAIYPTIAVALIALIGWRGSWGTATLFLILVVAPTAYLLARRPPPEEEDDGAIARRAAKRSWTRGEAVRDPLFMALLPCLLAAPFAITGVLFHQVRLVEAKDWPLELFAASYAAYAAGAIATSLAIGWLIDRFSAAYMLPRFLPLLAAGCAVLGLFSGPATAFIGMALLGAAGGGAMAINGALWAEVYGLDHLGAIRAVATSAMVLSTALAPYAMGAAMDFGVGVETLALILGGYAAIAAIALIPISGALRRRAAVAT